MKVMLIAATALGSSIFAPALAETVTIQYDTTDGDSQIWAYNEDSGTFEGPGGVTGTFAFNEATAVLCGNIDGDTVCVTFDDVSRDIGHTVGFTTNDGRSGTATVLEVK